MKKIILMAVISALAVCMSMGAAYAGNGNGGSDKGGNGQGGGDNSGLSSGLGIAKGILDGTPFEYEGTVVSLGLGQGMQIATADENVTIYGIGPVRYWAKVGVDRPAVGDTVVVSGYAVDYFGVERNIAMSITIDETVVQLRDPDTGKPLWIWGRYGGKK